MSTTIINKYNGFFTLGKLYKFHYTKTTSVNVIFGYKRTCKQCSEPMGHSLSSTKGMTVNSDTTLMLLLTNILSLTDLYNHPIFLVFYTQKADNMVAMVEIDLTTREYNFGETNVVQVLCILNIWHISLNILNLK